MILIFDCSNRTISPFPPDRSLPIDPSAGDACVTSIAIKRTPVPAITIRDGLNTDIVSANPHLSTGLGKYLTGQGAALLAGTDVVHQLRAPLQLANVGESGLGLSWTGDVALGESGASLAIEAGAKAVVGVLNRTGMQVFGTTFVGEPMKVPTGGAFVSFSLRPSLAVGLTK